MWFGMHCICMILTARGLHLRRKVQPGKKAISPTPSLQMAYILIYLSISKENHHVQPAQALPGVPTDQSPALWRAQGD
jgi:hypothetical protein